MDLNLMEHKLLVQVFLQKEPFLNTDQIQLPKLLLKFLYLRIVTESFGHNRWQPKYWNKTSVIEGCWALAMLLYSRLVQYMSTEV